MIRTYLPSDLDRVKELHRKFYPDEFELPDIERAFAAFVVERDGRMLGVGMVRQLAETIMLMDKSISMREKMTTIHQVVVESLFQTALHGYDQGHVFIQDPHFKDVLIKHFGLRQCKGEALVLDV